MAVYHQMGFHSANLLEEAGLSAYCGAILSPVNYTLSEVQDQIRSTSELPNFEMIFDPQLYVPTSDRGKLRTWEYFPADVDTADTSSESWWDELADSVACTGEVTRPTAICSPAMVPRVFTNDHFSSLVRVGNRLCERLEGTGIKSIQSAVAGLADLTATDRALAVASILTRSKADTIYLVLVGTVDPRRELADPEELKGAMRLIAALENSGMRVLVGFCSSDMLLWKHAGATACATGKFFNLRRFTRTRFEEPAGGGGHLPYWFEESLIAFLREADLVRIRGREMLSDSSLANPFREKILERCGTGEPWVALGWRQFMYWFADAEQRISAGALDIVDLLRCAEQRWLELDDANVLMEEPRNNGSWLRPWRRAVAEFAH